MPISPTYLHKRCHSVILAGRLAGLRGMGWAGRRLCRPPARGRWVGCAPLPGCWGEGGALSSKAPREGVDGEDSILTGRWAAPVGREGGSGWGTPGRGTRPVQRQLFFPFVLPQEKMLPKKRCSESSHFSPDFTGSTSSRTLGEL